MRKLCWALWVFLVGVQAAQQVSYSDSFWNFWPRIVHTDDIAQARQFHASMGWPGLAQDPSWGLNFFASSLKNINMSWVHAGIKAISYQETFGQAQAFVVEIGNSTWRPMAPADNRTAQKIVTPHTLWQNYQGGPIKWQSAHTYFENPDWAWPFTRTHPTYGAPVCTYPDGTPVTGAIGGKDTEDPRLHQFFDTCASKDILGNIATAHPTLLPNSSYTKGSVPYANFPPKNVTTFMNINKDSACPCWSSYIRASTLLAIDLKNDAIWSDNFAPFDSFSSFPARVAFGDWSVALFRDYLRSNFTSVQLRNNFGIDPSTLSSFDVRQAILQQIHKWGYPNVTSASIDKKDAVWSDARWTNSSLWSAYKIFKRVTGTSALANYYRALKGAAAEKGKQEYLLMGNGIASTELGWARGSVDMTSTEHTAGHWPDVGAKGYGLPPVGRHHSHYRLAREHTKGRFVNLWFYTDGFPNQLMNRSIVEPLYYEMMSTHALPKIFPNNPKYIGDDATNLDFFTFVAKSASILGVRKNQAEIGVYYSSSSILRDWTLAGPLDLDAQPHQLAFHGFGIFLSTIHLQWRPIPEWKLLDLIAQPARSGTVPADDPINGITDLDRSTMRILIIPESTSFPREHLAPLDAWISAGGTLVVTGASGTYEGESGNFAFLSRFSFSNLTGVPAGLPPSANSTLRKHGNGNVLYIPSNIGMSYWNAWDARDAMVPAFRAALAPVLPAAPTVTLINTTSSLGVNYIGANVYFAMRNATNATVFVDLNSYETNVAAVSNQIYFRLIWPSYIPNPDKSELRVSVVSPEGLAQATVAQWVGYTGTQYGALLVRVTGFNKFASVVLNVPTSPSAPSATPSSSVSPITSSNATSSYVVSHYLTSESS